MMKEHCLQCQTELNLNPSSATSNHEERCEDGLWDVYMIHNN